MSRLRQAYLKIRYWRQIRKGYGLLEVHGTKRHFVIANGSAFIMNGVDPLVRVDLATKKADKYPNPVNKGYKLTYRITPTNPKEEKDK